MAAIAFLAWLIMWPAIAVLSYRRRNLTMYLLGAAGTYVLIYVLRAAASRQNDGISGPWLSAYSDVAIVGLLATTLVAGLAAWRRRRREA